MPELGAFVPWLIREPDLYPLIPEGAFTISVGGWPMLRFTLLGVTAVWGFNFVTDQDGRFTEVQVHNNAPEALRKRRSFRCSSAALRGHLGPPNVVDMPEFDHLRWDNGRVWVDNSITTGRPGLSAKPVTWHSLQVTLSPRCRQAR
ncbi:MAG: hypothetical protein P9F75_13565 [Candidatus Contendobacter sp.]|nr:hypothetical protein [Candidatus Contendobacter sp.]